MKNIITTLLLSLIGTQFTLSQQTDWDKEELIGKVKSIVIQKFIKSGTSPNYSRVDDATETRKYLRNGFLHETHHFDSENNAKYFLRYHYNSAGKVERTEHHRPTKWKTPKVYENTTYPNDSVVITKAITPFCCCGYGRSTQSIYNSEGLLLRETYLIENEVEATFRYVYKQGYKPAEIYASYPNGEQKEQLIQRNTFTTHSNGIRLITQEEEIDGQGAVTYVKNYTYTKFDSQGNWVVRITTIRNPSNQVTAHKKTVRKIEYYK